MKTRYGFVSNSSSSSFLIYGVAVGDHEMIDRYNELNSSAIGDDPYDVASTIADELGVEFHMPYDGNTVYFGVSAGAIHDDETGAQFKERVQSMLKKYFTGCSYHSEAWYNG